MTDTAKRRLPFPSPSVDGAKDPAHLYHQELTGPTLPMPAERIGEAAYSAFMDLAGMEVTQAQYDALLAAMEGISANAIKELGKLQFPSEHGVQDGEQLFTPYLATLIFQLLGVLVGSMMPEKTHAERFAFIAEFMRAYAAFGVFNAAKGAGLTNQQAQSLAATKVTMQPAPMPVIAHVYLTRKKMNEEAAGRGITFDELAREKLAEFTKSQGTAGRVPGDPDDDAGPVRMEF